MHEFADKGGPLNTHAREDSRSSAWGSGGRLRRARRRRCVQLLGMKQPLAGVRVAVLAVDGVEQVEVTFPMKALRRAGADVRLLSLRPGRIRSLNFLWPGRKLAVDDILLNAQPEEYGALLIPGGFVNPDLLRQSERARQFVRRFAELGRPIAVICHGPQLLCSAGLLSGRRITSWPGIADDLKNAGAEWVDVPLVEDQGWVSSRGPHDLPRFIPAMVELFAARATRDLAPLPSRMAWAAQVSRWGTMGLTAAMVVRRRSAKRGFFMRKKQKSRLRAALPPIGWAAATAAGASLAWTAGRAIHTRINAGQEPLA